MKQFTLELLDSYQRPVIFLRSWHNASALLDTGAVCPVWTDKEFLLQRFGGRLLDQRVPISGFGGTAFGNVYELPELKIGELIYPSFKIIACLLPDASYQMILSATMFSNLIYEIDDKHHKLNITVPNGESNIRNMRIRGSTGRYHILCDSGMDAPVRSQKL